VRFGVAGVAAIEEQLAQNRRESRQISLGLRCEGG
jgi:hypothetical protein